MKQAGIVVLILALMVSFFTGFRLVMKAEAISADETHVHGIVWSPEILYILFKLSPHQLFLSFSRERSPSSGAISIR